MAEIISQSLLVIGLFGVTSLSFLTYHTYKFDACRCLIPRRKDWFRCLLVWMLFLSNMAFIVWAGGWLYVKVQLGMVAFGPVGARPWPSALFPAKYRVFNVPLTVMFGFCYGLQASLTAHEGLFWYFMMRSIRKPQAAKPFFRSYFFYAWIGVSMTIMGVQQTIPWINHDPDGGLELQLSRELLAGGIIEMIVRAASTIVVLKFPRFLREVEALGAGPDVRIRLYKFHQLNLVRTCFRFTFSLPLIIFGVDGMTKEMVVNMSPLAADFLATLIGGSLALVMMISIILYLPRSPPSAAYHQVMVADRDGTGGFALMSLMREGGQWEDADDERRMATAAEKRMTKYDDAPFANARVRASSWGTDVGDEWAADERAKAQVPKVLADFSSPVAINTEPEPQGPIRIQMHVERNVHED